MERCVLYLYPYIPDVLFKGLGHTQIDKLLAIRGNAEEVWANYQFETDIIFDSLWSDNLSKFNEATPFQTKEFQSELISGMVDALDGKISFEALYLDIDLDEQKFKKMAAKQQEIDSLVEKQSSKSVPDRNNKQQNLNRLSKMKIKLLLPQQLNILLMR